MRFAFQQFTENVVTSMRRLGYVFQRHQGTEMSFVRPLAQSGFPRFHCYVKIESGRYIFNLHLDQKKETYGADTRHHGEYGPQGALKEELDRISTLSGTIVLLA